MICISQLNTLSDFIFTITIEYITGLSPRTRTPVVLAYDQIANKGDSKVEVIWQTISCGLIVTVISADKNYERVALHLN